MRVAQTHPVTAAKIVVEHVPEILPASEKAAPEEGAVPEEVEGEWAGERRLGLALSPSDWSDLYGMPAEVTAFIVGAPELDIPDERCKAQGVRLARFCQRHNIMLPPWLDVVPLAAGAVGDYGKLFRDASILMKERRRITEKKKVETFSPSSAAPGEVKVPGSTVEHVSAEVPGDIDERIAKALKGGRK